MTTKTLKSISQLTWKEKKRKRNLINFWKQNLNETLKKLNPKTLIIKFLQLNECGNAIVY